jgi:hypothetical protein
MYINVRDFGAKGNGTDIDTSGVIDAFNASSGELIYIPKGDYRHTEQIKDVGILFDAESNDCHSLANRIANCGLQPFLNQGDGSNTHSPLWEAA